MTQGRAKHRSPAPAATLAVGLCACLAALRGCAAPDPGGARPRSVPPPSSSPAKPAAPIAPPAPKTDADLSLLPDVRRVAEDAPASALIVDDFEIRRFTTGLQSTTAWLRAIAPADPAKTKAIPQDGQVNYDERADKKPGSPKEAERPAPAAADAGRAGSPTRAAGEGAGPGRPATPGGGGGKGSAGSTESLRKEGDRFGARDGPPGGGAEAPSRPPAGLSVGRPSEGLTPEERRQKVEVPLRVGQDVVEVEQAKREGLSDEYASDPTPRSDEELWVIQRPVHPAANRAGPESPRSGALMLREGSRRAERSAEVKETAARASIAGPVARVTLVQRFENPGDAASDSMYVLPLPRDAAITDFVMTIGERRIRGVIREREEAERIYLDARRAGKTASLLGEDAPNLFVQKVGNLAPRGTLDVTITYFHTLEYSAGAYEFVLPLAASPKYQGAAAISPLVRDGRGVSVEVQVDAGVPIRGLSSPTHGVDVSAVSTGEARVVLRPAAELPNRDFVLRIMVAGKEGPTAGVIPQPDQSGTYFSMVIVPPAADAGGSRGPVELVLVPDYASAGTPERAAAMQAAASRLLSRLTERDRVLVVTDPTSAGVPAAATAGVVLAAARQAGSPAPGATLAGLLRAAMDLPAPAGDRVICVLSRGEPADGVSLMRDVRSRLGAARVFAICVDEPGASPTLESLARLGRGGVIHLGGAAGGVEAPLDAFIDELSRPVLTDLAIDWGGAEVADVFPRRLPDLCAGRPVHVVGRMVKPPEDGAPLRVLGTSRGASGLRREAILVPWRTGAEAPGAVHTLWARAKVLSMAETLGHDASGDVDLRKRIVATALAHNLVSPFTSFICVDATSGPPAPLQAASRDGAAPRP